MNAVMSLFHLADTHLQQDDTITSHDPSFIKTNYFNQSESAQLAEPSMVGGGLQSVGTIFSRMFISLLFNCFLEVLSTVM